MPAHAAPHIAAQCGAPARPISRAVAASAVCMRSDDAREALPRAVGLQVLVEHHRDARARSTSPAAVTCMADRLELDQARLAPGHAAASSSAAKCLRKSIRWASSIDSNSSRPWHISAMMTARRSRSSRVSARPRTTGSWPWSSGVVVLGQRLGVLAVGGADAADGRHAQADQVAVGLRAVALEVAVQPALALGHRQRVVGQREVVHADVHVAVRRRSRRCALRQHRHACPPPAGSSAGIDAPLRLEALRQVRVGVQRDAVGPQLAPPARRCARSDSGVCCGRP